MKLFEIAKGQQWVNLDAVVEVQYGPQPVRTPGVEKTLTLVLPSSSCVYVTDPKQIKEVAKLLGFTLPPAEKTKA